MNIDSVEQKFYKTKHNSYVYFLLSCKRFVSIVWLFTLNLVNSIPVRGFNNIIVSHEFRSQCFLPTPRYRCACIFIFKPFTGANEYVWILKFHWQNTENNNHANNESYSSELTYFKEKYHFFQIIELFWALLAMF